MEQAGLARLAVDWKGRGVVAFDLAGDEMDYPAKNHLEAFYHVMNHNQNVTIHAGEGFGPASIHQALHRCGANRIGHGTRLHEDEDLLAYVESWSALQRFRSRTGRDPLIGFAPGSDDRHCARPDYRTGT